MPGLQSLLLLNMKTSLHKPFSLNPRSTLIALKYLFLKETVRLILSGPPCKDDNALSLHPRSTLIALKYLFLKETVRLILSGPPCKDGNSLFQLWFINLGDLRTSTAGKHWI